MLRPKMAISMPPKKKYSRLSKPKVEGERLNFCFPFLYSFLCRVPILLLILIFLWSSSTTIISGNIVHLCLSSRKLNNLYCLSAGAQTHPNIELNIPLVNDTLGEASSINSAQTNPNFEINIPSMNSTLGETFTINPSPKTDLNQNQDPLLIFKAGDEGGKAERVEEAVKAVEDQIKQHRSWGVPAGSNHAIDCDGRAVFVYDLPPKFNKDLLSQCGDMIPWMGKNFCRYFDNNALGEPIYSLGKRWYKTHQYSLEPIFHSRVLKHPCRVWDESKAKLFYVPFYGGMDILRWHFKNVSNEVKDTLSLDLVKWLESQRFWSRNSGKDHVFVLGKISWDFRRNVDSSWGTRLLELEQFQNPIKLLIERQPWHLNDVGIPHPTHFHPHSDEDILAWQTKIISSPRRHLVSFAGAARPDAPENIRSILIEQCISAEQSGKRCKFLDCGLRACEKPESVIQLFMESEFCLQPPGDSPTRKSVFDSLVSGCIPVLFDRFTAYYQYPWHLPEDYRKYSVFIENDVVKEQKVDVVDILMKVSVKERDDMRRYIVYELLPGLVYGDLDSKFERFHDAFSITMSNLLERVNRLESNYV